MNTSVPAGSIRRVLDAHVSHLAHQQPTARRYYTAAHIADRLLKGDLDLPNLPPDHQARLLDQYLTILRRDDWSVAVRADLDPTAEYSTWFLETVAARLHLLT